VARAALGSGGAVPISNPSGLASLYPAQETPDPGHLFVVRREEVQEAGREFRGGLSVQRRLLLDLIEKSVQSCVDLKERIRFGNCRNCRFGGPIDSSNFRRVRHESSIEYARALRQQSSVRRL
jgi:hypothetical protein